MSEDPYFLIRRSNLPEVIQKTTLVTELLTRRRDMSVLEAVRAIGLSRSAYYKYKDAVRPFSEAMSGQIVTIALTLEHKPGVLSTVLNTVASSHGNILTCPQRAPSSAMPSKYSKRCASRKTAATCRILDHTNRSTNNVQRRRATTFASQQTTNLAYLQKLRAFLAITASAWRPFFKNVSQHTTRRSSLSHMMSTQSIYTLH
ncbi:hypothetical protein AYJ22_01825 [Ferroacidibacillus organovorans]|nr:hypothetical protein [Ferroacidibacillus organovorans]KYP80915.1 hypothetical protein AYJ22_01825 [Ferroacidibacillus organovorans]